MTRVLIAGYYGARNLGDEAILGALLQGLAGAPATVTVLSHDPAATASTHGVAACGWDTAALVAAVADAEVVVLGGGGLLQDYWGSRTEDLFGRRQGGLAAYASVPLLARALGKPAMLYAVGVGPLRTAEGRELARTAAAAVDVATVRDEESRDLLAAIGVDGETVA